MNRIDQTFQKLNEQKALIPYITAGDPSLSDTLHFLHTLVDNGADIIELGVPFSDPMADGTVIQHAAQRALKNHVSLADVLDLCRQFRQTNQHTPIILMGYLNPIHRMGYSHFAQQAKDAGVDGILTVDCPIEHISPLQSCLKAQSIHTIFLIAPTTSKERMAHIAQEASGFVYYVSLKGVTGSSDLDIHSVARKIADIRHTINLPVAVGFGIKTAEQAHAVGQIADAVVIGSALVDVIGKNPTQANSTLAPMVQQLKAALTP